MAIYLHNLKKSKGSRKKKKRVGRGNSSGHGTYSTRGLKGQRSRSGGKNKLKLRGMKMIIQKIPKQRGFKGKQKKVQLISLKTINDKFSDNERVNPKVLLQRDLIDNIKDEVKVLGSGDIKKKITIEKCKISQSARGLIEKAGGTVK